jgi:dephospho-CoA kinase
VTVSGDEISGQLLTPRVAVVVGPKAAGKDKLASYLVRQHGVRAVEVGAFARKLAEEARENHPHLQYDTSAKDLARHRSEYIMCWLVAATAANEKRWARALVVTGVRTPAEAAALKAHFGAALMLAFVRVGDQKTRFDRTRRRAYATDPNDFQTFVEQDEQLKSDHALAETARLADITLWNSDSLEAYYQQIETHIVPHLFPEE